VVNGAVLLAQPMAQGLASVQPEIQSLGLWFLGFCWCELEEGVRAARFDSQAATFGWKFSVSLCGTDFGVDWFGLVY